MRNKELIYNTALSIIMGLGIDPYHTIFLANMVLRKIRHPEEKMDEIAAKVMKKMPKIYPKKDIVQVSANKCLDQLEEAIEVSKVPDEWLTKEENVSCVVKKLCSIVIERLDNEKETK